MKTALSQTLTQRQQLVMTPKLRQAIEILTMTRLDLQQHMEQSLEENPLLDLEEDIREEATQEQELDSDDLEVKICPICGAENPIRYARCSSCGTALTPEEDSVDEFSDIDLSNLFDDTVSVTEQMSWNSDADEDRPREDIAEPVSLRDHLMMQLGMMKLDEEQRRIGETIIGYIDDDGLLSVDVPQIAEILGVDEEEVEEVLRIIQESLDPVGVGARDVGESLLIQMKVAGEEDSLAAKIIRDHFDDLLQNRIPKIAKELNVEIDDILDAIEHMKSFDPKPGNGFAATTRERDIIPDVVVEYINDKEYRVISNDEGLPRLRINQRYLNMLKNKDSLPPKTRQWIEDYFRRALDLMKMIEQRRQTVKKVTEAILSYQSEFLTKGFKYLKPLTLKEIAEIVGVHESTVSRVVNGKWVQTPMGVFELKEFFSSSLETETGADASSKSVKEIIKEMVSGEDPANPLSDSEIVSKLGERGIKVARRTIAKYRSELGIPSSSKRRKKW